MEDLTKHAKYWGGTDPDAPKQKCQKHGEYGRVSLQLVVDHKRYDYPYCPFCWGESMQAGFPVEQINQNEEI